MHVFRQTFTCIYWFVFHKPNILMSEKVQLRRKQLHVLNKYRGRIGMKIWLRLVWFWSETWTRLSIDAGLSKCPICIYIYNIYIYTYHSTPIARATKVSVLVNTLRLKHNGRHFADDTFKRIFLNENVMNSIKMSPKFVRHYYLDQRWFILLTHICATRSQWVKYHMSRPT